MDKVLTLLLLVASANCYYIDNSSKPALKYRIVGGEEVEITTVPYIAQILLNDWLECGSSIISEYWLLTAAHCVVKTNGLSVMTGSTLREIGGVSYKVDKIIKHEHYDPSTLDNDIALIKLKTPIAFNNKQKPITIAKSAPKAGDKLKISGYGRIQENYPHSRVLKSAVIPVIDFKVCQKQYSKDKLTDSIFCAGIGGTDTCQGDSGGPAVVNGQLVGVVSSGEGCASKEYAGIYMKVYSYLGWITEKSGLKL